MNKLLSLLSIFFILFCINCEGKNKGNNYISSIPHEKKLKLESEKLINFLIKKDIDGIAGLLSDRRRIEIWPDSYTSKEKVILKLKNPNDNLYNYLFDSNKYSKYKSKKNRKKVKLLCIRDQILYVKNKNLKIKSLKKLGLKKPIHVKVTYFWEGKENKSNVFDGFIFIYNETTKKWETNSLVFHIW